MKSLLKTLNACKAQGKKSLKVTGLFNSDQLDILRQNGFKVKPYDQKTDLSIIYW